LLKITQNSFLAESVTCRVEKIIKIFDLNALATL
jgi:hypothetical protein